MSQLTFVMFQLLGCHLIRAAVVNTEVYRVHSQSPGSSVGLPRTSWAGQTCYTTLSFTEARAEELNVKTAWSLRDYETGLRLYLKLCMSMHLLHHFPEKPLFRGCAFLSPGGEGQHSPLGRL